MNTIERRVSDALHEHVNDVPISTKDLAQLQRELHRRARAPHAHYRPNTGSKVWQLAVAACAVTGVVLGMLALRSDPEPPIQPAGPVQITKGDLAGLWRSEQFAGLFWRFDEQGATGTHDGSGLFSEGADWTVVPGLGSVTLTRVSPDCDTMQWRTAITPEGRMRATVTKGGPSCPFVLGEVTDFTRVSPASVAGAGASSTLPEDVPAGVTRLEQLVGAWLLRGTGEVLTVNAAGRYDIHDLGTATSAQQLGMIAVERDGSVSFTPLDTPRCAAVYESVTTRGNSLAASRADSSCGQLGGANDTWIRLTEQ